MDFDPDGDGRELYGPFKHYTMDYARTAPGGEWSFTGYNWDPWRHGPAPRDAISAEVRRLGDRRSLVMYASAQGSAGICRIHRYEGEIAVPCGRIEPHLEGNGVPFNKFKLWYDADGDGKESPDEVSFAPRPGGDFTSFDVDSRGDVWVVLHDSNDPHLRRWTCKGIDARGAPIYGTAAGDYEDVPYPAPIGPSPGAVARVRVDRERDVLYLYGPNADQEESKTHPWLLARYDRWGEGNRKATYAIRMPTPATDLNFIVQPPLPAYLNFTYQAFDVAGDYVFAAELTGPVHVFAAATGERVTVLNPGPEVSGFAWQDAHAGLHAFARSDGEYIIITQNSGFRARNNLFRWRPKR
jgi:hypothetical protein